MAGEVFVTVVSADRADHDEQQDQPKVSADNAPNIGGGHLEPGIAPAGANGSRGWDR